MPGSRSTANGATTRRAASGGTSGPRGMSSAKTTAVTAVSTPLSSSARRTPPRWTASGSRAAAMSPPRATDICRIPSANPRRSGGKPWKTETVAPTATSAPATPLAKSAMPSPTGFESSAPTISSRPHADPAYSSGFRGPERSTMTPAAMSATALPKAVALMSAPRLAALRS